MLNKLSYNLMNELNEADTKAIKVKKQVFMESNKITVNKFTHIDDVWEALDACNTLEEVENVIDEIPSKFGLFTAEQIDDNTVRVTNNYSEWGDDSQSETVDISINELEEQETLKEEAITVWTTEIEVSEDEYQFRYDEYKEEKENNGEDDIMSYEEFKNNYQADEGYYYEESDVIIEDFKNNIMPVIENQCPNGYVVLSGSYNSNYPDFKPSTTGGRVQEATYEAFTDLIANYDTAEILNDNGHTLIYLGDHDGSNTMGLYAFPENILELAKEMGYEAIVREDYQEEYIEEQGIDAVIEEEFNNDLYYNNIDVLELLKHQDKLIPIQANF